MTTTALFAAFFACQPTVWLRWAFKPAPPRAVQVARDEVRELRMGETLAVDHAGGQGVVCLEGALWITHDHGPCDEVTERGGRHESRCNARMRVHALADSRLCMPESAARNCYG